jgi:hypothetical protein
VSDGVPDNEKPIDKPNSNGHGPVSGMSGGFGEGGQETFKEWGVV